MIDENNKNNNHKNHNNKAVKTIKTIKTSRLCALTTTIYNTIQYNNSVTNPSDDDVYPNECLERREEGEDARGFFFRHFHHDGYPEMHEGSAEGNGSLPIRSDSHVGYNHVHVT